MASTVSRPIVYFSFLLNKYQEQEEEEHQVQQMIKKYHHQQIPVVMQQFHDDGPWEIKKVLKHSDVDMHLSRLLIPCALVKSRIFSYWNSEHVNQVEKECCFKVRVMDFDTLTYHELIFKKWKSNNSYVFQGDWNSQFVSRRKLMKNDVIGMFWNPFNSFFVFKLIKRAKPACPSLK